MKAFFIYPHQLFEEIETLKEFDIVFLIEEPLFFSEFPFHKQKLILHRASMKAYEQYLISHKVHVDYVEHNQTIPLKLNPIKEIAVYDVTDDWLCQRLNALAKKIGAKLTTLETPMFVTEVKDITHFFSERHGKRRYFMNDFYVWQRRRLSILTENDQPLGGVWNYDSENRKKLPKSVTIPETFFINTSPFVTEAREYVEKHFSNNFGDTENFWCPITHHDARKHFQIFLKDRLKNFGPYEDSITERSPSVFHSTISPLLNNGLLTPKYVIFETLAFAKKHDIPIASLEGFIRQIIGWREYIRAIYLLEGRKIRSGNHFKADKSIPQTLWSGTTGIAPVDDQITTLRKYAYTHHIPRLMILGNFMNLCGIKPHDVYQWFMEMYIDAYDWVMVPNVYSMALYADGGILTTKPYIASSNYIKKMSDYKKGPWTEKFDALFWNFVGKHYEKLHNEGRLGFLGAQYNKISTAKRNEYQKIAQDFFHSQ